MSRHKGKKTQKDKKNKKTKTENVANRRRVYDVTQVTYEIIIGLERPSCEPRCTRATLVSFPYHVRHFCRAHTPIFYLHIYPLRASFTQTHHFATSRFLHFSFIYRISTIARATTSLPPPPPVIFCLRGEPSCRSDHRAIILRIPIWRHGAERPRDDDAVFVLARARAYTLYRQKIASYTRVSRETIVVVVVVVVAFQFAKNHLESAHTPGVEDIVENSPATKVLHGSISPG